MKRQGTINRRDFIRTSGLGIAGVGIAGGRATAANDPDGQNDPFPKIKKFKTLGRTGFEASDIGIGTSRSYPTPVMTALLDAGINYIDTGESYGRGSAEKSIGEAIKGRDRKSLFITTKLHLTENASEEEIRNRFDKCLERLGTAYIDCLMMHGAPSIAALKNENFHTAVGKLKKEGRLRFTGISNHGARFGRAEDVMEEVLMGAVDDGRFDVLLIVYNFMKTDPGEKIMAACEKKNIGVTIMKSNPVNRYYDMKERVEKMKAEGKEVDERSRNYLESMQETADRSEAFMKKHNLKDYNELRYTALKFVLSNPKVDVLNLAFNSFEDVENMLKVSGTGPLAGREQEQLELYSEAGGQFYCRHACGICESACPGNIPVNTIMRYNHYFEAGRNEKYAMEKFAGLKLNGSLNACAACSGLCESACPYRVPVRSLLRLAEDNLRLT